MARQSVLDRFEVFIGTAVLAAHASKFKKGFRQGDVCWVIELFADWLEFVEEHAELKIQNTQVARYLDTLVKEGFARRLSSGARRCTGSRARGSGRWGRASASGPACAASTSSSCIFSGARTAAKSRR